MKVRFFKDNFNARFCWNWPDDGYVCEDSAEIENYIAHGIRHEVVEEVEKQPETVEKEQEVKPEVENKPKKRGRKKAK